MTNRNKNRDLCTFKDRARQRYDHKSHYKVVLDAEDSEAAFLFLLAKQDL